MAKEKGMKLSARSEVQPFQVPHKPRILPISSGAQNRRGLEHSPRKRHHSTEKLREDKDRGLGTQGPPAYKAWTWEHPLLSSSLF